MTDQVWISALGIHYKLGLDGLNVALVVLTTVLFSASLVWASFRKWDRPHIFYFHFGLAESAVLGAFCAQDLALFVVFFDLMLIPFYFLSGIWGSGDRVRATTKLVIYTLVGSFFMLAGAIATGALASSQHHTGLTFVISDLQRLPLSHTSQDWIFLCFALAFVVKMPLVPFHGWLAEGYKSMPIPAVAVFSAILSKVAAYGFLRIVLPLFPYAVGALPDADADRRAGLDPVGHGGRVHDPGRAAGDRLLERRAAVVHHARDLLAEVPGRSGSAAADGQPRARDRAAFFIVAALAARAGGSELLSDMGGLAFRAPVLASLFLIVILATLAMPGSSNFIGEFMILLGVFKAKLAISVIAFAGVVGAAVYALRLFISSMHNRVGPRAEVT